jgi:spermidine synthase
MLNQKKLCFQEQTSSGLVEVWQENKQRWLTIDDVEQSRIDIENNKQLLAPLHHAFLAILLFIDTPKKILLAGLGGGAVARYLCGHSPGIYGDAVEKDSLISDLAVRFFDFPDKNVSVHVDDVRQWRGNGYDLIIVDIAEEELTPEWLFSENSLVQLKRQLSPGGVIVFNILIVDTQSFTSLLQSVRNIFDKRTLCLSVPDYKNIVISVFNNEPPYYLDEQLDLRVKNLTSYWGIDFEKLYSQLKKDNPENSGVM